jgi:hypothetical protein
LKLKDALYPTKSQVLLWMASACAALISATWFIVADRTSHPHPDAVIRSEFNLYVNNQRDFQSEVLATLREMRSTIRTNMPD